MFFGVRTIVQGGGADRDANDARRPIFFSFLTFFFLAHQLSHLAPNPVLCLEKVSLLKIYIYFATKKYAVSQSPDNP